MAYYAEGTKLKHKKTGKTHIATGVQDIGGGKKGQDFSSDYSLNTSNTSPVKKENSLYISETNWGKLQKQYHPDQLEYATERKGKDIYWNADRHIEDFKYNKSQELDIARHRLQQGTGTLESQKIDTANIAYANKSKSELDKIADDINAGQQEDFNKKEEENGDAISSRYDDLKTKTEEITNNLMGGVERPEAPSMVDLYEEFQDGKKGEMYKTTELEESLSAFKDEARTAEARMRERIEYERDQPVAMGVIAGKTSEIAKQEQQNIDFANRQIAYITDQLNTKYNMIETIMNLTQTDYTNALNSYDKQFAQNLQIMNFVKGIEAEERNEKERQQDNARANLQIIMKEMSNSTYTDLNDNQKIEIRKLEVQAGFPSGFMEILKNTAGEDNILSTTSHINSNGDKYIDVLTREKNGELKINNIYVGKVKVSSSGSSGSSEKTNAEKQVEKEEKEIKQLLKDASDMIIKLDNGEISWDTSFKILKLNYPRVSNDKLNQILGGQIPYNEETGEFDMEKATGRASIGYREEKKEMNY